MFSKLSPLRAFLLAQFLSNFVDNMILFIVLAIIKRDGYPHYYLPLVQDMFIISYLILSPWVGRFSDNKPKPRVLIIGNVIKALGIFCMVVRFDPAISYMVVGIGSAVYSPAKYGILPVLAAEEDQLLRANSSLESITIMAVLAGSVAGGFLSDWSIVVALVICIMLYGISIGVNMLIPANQVIRIRHYSKAIPEFFEDTVQLFKNTRSHYALVGTGSFWMASSVLRMIIFIWVPLTLGISSRTHISMIIAVIGIGVATGAVVSPYFVTIKTYPRTLWYSVGMTVVILSFLVLHSLTPIILALLLVGFFGGIYIVPLNASIQQVGHQTIGAGQATAVQNFVKNIFMFLGVGVYLLALMADVSPPLLLAGVGIALMVMVGYMFFFLHHAHS